MTTFYVAVPIKSTNYQGNFMKSGSSLTSVVTRVDHLRRHARDFLARPAQIRLSASTAAPSLVLDDGTGALSFGINDLAHDQIADY
jgi:hypothetical protein